MGSYILDFICWEHRLVVEVDGGQHAGATDADAVRTAWLEAQGFRVIRFWNTDVLRNIDGVLLAIADELSQ
jgi:very-short-patch-repair endonuclease